MRDVCANSSPRHRWVVGVFVVSWVKSQLSGPGPRVGRRSSINPVAPLVCCADISSAPGLVASSSDCCNVAIAGACFWKTNQHLVALIGFCRDKRACSWSIDVAEYELEMVVGNGLHLNQCSATSRRSGQRRPRVIAPAATEQHSESPGSRCTAKLPGIPRSAPRTWERSL